MVAVAEGSHLRVGETIKSGPWEGFEVISVYTRAQAIEDGELVDVSKLAQQSGFRFPVAVTAGVWAELERVAQRTNAARPENLWPCDASDMAAHVLHGLREVIRRLGGDTDRFDAKFNLGGSELSVWALCGPGDDAEPVITVMLPGED